jgi:hypothetical protein
MRNDFSSSKAAMVIRRAALALVATLLAPPVWAEQQRIGPYPGEFGRSLWMRQSELIVGAPAATPNGEDATGAVHVFAHQAGQWALTHTLSPPDGAEGDRFGQGVARMFAQGNEPHRIIVGAPGHDGAALNAGAVYVFRQVGAEWVFEAKLSGSGAAAGAREGSAVTAPLWGDTIISGAPDAANQEGRAYVYRVASGVWSEAQILASPQPGVRGRFGSAIDFHLGVMVGAPGDGSVEGRVHNYGGSGQLQWQWTIIGEPGFGAALSGGAVGAPLSWRGSARFFDAQLPTSRRLLGFQPDINGDGLVNDVATPHGGIASSPDLGIILATLGTTDCGHFADLNDDCEVTLVDLAAYLSNYWAPGARTDFGRAVAVTGNIAVIGAPDELTVRGRRTGAIHVFENGANGWARVRRYTPTGAQPGDGVGASLMLDFAGKAAIGAVSASGTGYVVIDDDVTAADPLPPSAVHAELMDNGGLFFSGRYIESVDIRLSTPADDWTMTVISIQAFGGWQIYPPVLQGNISLPPFVPVDNDEDGIIDPIPPAVAWRNQRSTPHDFPNVIEIGSPNSTLGPAQWGAGGPTGFQGLAYFDVSPDENADFVVFRLALAITDPDRLGLTLDFQGPPVARVQGAYSTRGHGGVLIPFEVNLYERSCPGDLDHDGFVGQSDLGILLGDFGCDSGTGACAGDADGDGDTDQTDLGILLANYGCS